MVSRIVIVLLTACFARELARHPLLCLLVGLIGKDFFVILPFASRARATALAVLDRGPYSLSGPHGERFRCAGSHNSYRAARACAIAHAGQTCGRRTRVFLGEWHRRSLGGCRLRELAHRLLWSCLVYLVESDISYSSGAWSSLSTTSLRSCSKFFA